MWALTAWTTWVAILASAAPTAGRSGPPTPVSSPTPGTPKPHWPGAHVLKRFDFEQDEDLDLDRRPDDWTRIRRRGFPHYVRCVIVSHGAATGERCLRFSSNGGRAGYLSPPIPADNRHEYLVWARAKTEGLRRSRASISLNFLDKDQRFLRRDRRLSPSLGGTSNWKALVIPPTQSADDRVAYAMVGCHLEAPGVQDIQGKCWFDHVVVARIPLVTVVPSHPDGMFMAGQSKQVDVRLLGVEASGLEVQARLRDMRGKTLWSATRPVPHARSQEATFRWPLPRTDVGYFRLSVQLAGPEGAITTKTVGLSVLAPGHRTGTGWGVDFGLSCQLPTGPIDTFVTRIMTAGVKWLKLPLWAQVQKHSRFVHSSRTFDRLARRLQENHIRLVGVLGVPPAEFRTQLPGPLAGVSEVFQRPVEEWKPYVEPVLARHGLRVRWWQLGADHDTSFVGVSGLEALLDRVNKAFNKVAIQVRVGLPWDWMYPTPGAAAGRHHFVALDVTPELSPQQLPAYIKLANQAGAETWVTLRCLPQSRYQRTDRLADLAERVIYAKLGRAHRIFLTETDDPDVGLVDAAGRPNELYMAWRTLVQQLSGATYLGRMVLPGGSTNAVFVRGAQALMVAWNHRPASERVYLGEAVTLTDLWGRTTDLSGDQGPQVFRTNPLPVFLNGCHRDVMRWRLGVKLGLARIESAYTEHHNTLGLANTFPQGVTGELRLHLPRRWTAQPAEWSLQLAAGAPFQTPVAIAFPFNESQGTKLLRLAFDLSAERHFRFSVWRPIRLGTDDLELRVDTRLSRRGELVVQQYTTNYASQALSFRCWVDAPLRKRQESMIVKLSVGATDTKLYHFPDGRGLIGKRLRLTIEEQDGPRLINKEFPAQP